MHIVYSLYIYIYFKDVSREFDDFRVNSRTVLSSLQASYVVGTCNILPGIWVSFLLGGVLFFSFQNNTHTPGIWVSFLLGGVLFFLFKIIILCFIRQKKKSLLDVLHALFPLLERK